MNTQKYDIKINAITFYSSNPKDCNKKNKKRKDRVKLEIDMSIEEWKRIKPDLVYPHSAPRNRRHTDSQEIIDDENYC